MDGIKNEMTYNGNHLFHYTSFEAMMKILLTGMLRFGDFKNMNDIAEVRREYLADIPDEIINEVFSMYKSLSFTKDVGPMERGFAIDTLWGYYAEKGNGACLVFDKKKLFDKYWTGFAISGAPRSLEINYIDGYTNLIAFDGKTRKQIEEEIDSIIQDIFFTKDQCWSHEKEIRMITKQKGELPIHDAIIGVVICAPKTENLELTDQYRILERIQQIRPFHIYHYCTVIGEKSLSSNNERKWPLLGVDWQLDSAA